MSACRGFLFQCTLILEIEAQRYLSEKVAFIISLLQGRALKWAETVWRQDGPAMASYDAFIHHFREVFDLPDGDTSVQVRLLRLCQGTMSFHEYTQRFRMLATESGWNKPALITVFRQGIEPALRLHLAGYDNTVGLEQFILLAIRVANRHTALHTSDSFRSPCVLTL